MSSSYSAIELVYKPVSFFKPFINNARTHSFQQISQIESSIGKFGFINPIICRPNGEVIAGHGRLLAAKKAGIENVPTIILDRLSDNEARALRLADNKIALNSGWDPDMLRIELGALSMELEIDIGVTGFTVGEIDVVMAAPADPDDEVVPAVRDERRTNVGDIWQLGPHRVGCGDARDIDFLQQVVGDGEAIDCAFLDPPYNVPIKGHANVKARHREFAMASGEMSDAAFGTFLEETVGACVQLSRNGAVHFICMDWRHFSDLSTVGDALYGEQLNLCVWNKSNAGMGSLYRSKHELVFVFRVGTRPHLNAVELGRHGRNRTNVWDYASVNSFKGTRTADLQLHPTVKPTAMIADAIQDVTRRGDRVLDVFLGAGTTLLAAERTGRTFRGLDIDPEYVDVAVDRWTAMTGGEPLKIRKAGW